MKGRFWPMAVGTTLMVGLMGVAVNASPVPAAPAWVLLDELGDGESLALVDPQPDDGKTEPVVVGGKEAIKGVLQTGGMYVYFKVDDSWLFESDVDTAVEMTVDYFDGGKGMMILSYDSWDPKAPVDGAYRDAKAWVLRNTGEWKQITFVAKKVRFANRENGGADFRLNLPQELTAVRAVKVARPPVVQP